MELEASCGLSSSRWALEIRLVVPEKRIERKNGPIHELRGRTEPFSEGPVCGKSDEL
jgi:hypothetical protein